MKPRTPREPEASQSVHEPPEDRSRPNIVLKELQISLTPAVWLALIGLLSSVLGTTGYLLSLLAR